MAPLRELPEHSVATSVSAVYHHVEMSEVNGGGSDSTKSKDATLVETSTSGKVMFKEPDFGTDGANDLKLEDLAPGEDGLSPTQTRT
jgi:hypothetical protein